MTGNITTLRYLVDEVGVRTLNSERKGYTPLQMAVVWGQCLGMSWLTHGHVGVSEREASWHQTKIFLTWHVPSPGGKINCKTRCFGMVCCLFNLFLVLGACGFLFLLAPSLSVKKPAQQPACAELSQ